MFAWGKEVTIKFCNGKDYKKGGKRNQGKWGIGSIVSIQAIFQTNSSDANKHTTEYKQFPKLVLFVSLCFDICLEDQNCVVFLQPSLDKKQQETAKSYPKRERISKIAAIPLMTSVTGYASLLFNYYKTMTCQ